jgi:hypothetical protein
MASAALRDFDPAYVSLGSVRSVELVLFATFPLNPPEADIATDIILRRLVPIVFSNSGSGCQALREPPCRPHCSLRGRGVPSA